MSTRTISILNSYLSVEGLYNVLLSPLLLLWMPSATNH